MITIYSTFRSFEHERYNKIQNDAIKSWLTLDPKPEVIIMGKEPGTAEVCKKYGFKHVPKVKTSKADTPYVNSLINKAERHASNDIMLLVSGDIIIAQDTIEVAKAASKQLPEFCVCARKKHVDIKPNGRIKDVKWATWQAGDYWLHSKGIYAGMPPFLIGRHLVERWMYRWCCNKNALVDASGVATVLHQNHPRDFKPKNKEKQWNRDMWDQNYFEVDKWKDTEWYGVDCKHIGLNFANHVMKKDYSLVDNPTPQRPDWKMAKVRTQPEQPASE